ncbi:MAG: LamG domain-containing protein, partial [Candidatus Aminicenantes bacterium]|nr:LamG domain-containing protein [Candidatus Aminicenantes bacterium]
MIKPRILIALAALVFASSPSAPGLGESQATGGGDQFLDGIGETGLVARYLFNGHAEDGSRNNFHAALRGEGASFVQDPRFGGQVLELAGKGGHVQLPGQALSGEDTVSVVGWVSLNSDSPGQRFFDFGRAGAAGLGAWATGSAPGAGFRAYAASGSGAVVETNAVPIPANRWTHLAVVLDPANRSLTGYLNGAQVIRVENVEAGAGPLFDKSPGETNRLYIGRGPADSEPTLNAKVRDFRVYRIALTEPQVAAIRNNALKG